jgi:type VI secretion system protein ImpF
MPAIVSSSPMPLFDRLAANGEAQLSGAVALRESVARELSRLFNTRSPLTFEAFAASDGSVLDYGVPDFTERSMYSGPDRDAIAAIAKHAITLFEPRLVNVSVDFVVPAGPAPRAVLTIGGDVRSGSSVARVVFKLAKDAEGALAARVTE